jgi:outer membrane usher protein
MGGVGGDWLLGHWAVFNGSLAASRTAASAGSQYGLGISHATPWFNAGVSLLKADSGFNDIASVNGDQRPGTTLRGNLGGSIPGVGSLSAVFAKKRVNLYDDYNQTSSSVQTSTLSLIFSRPLRWGAYASVTAFHDFTGATGNGLFVGVSIPIGDGGTLSVDSSHSGGSSYQTVQAEHPAVDRGDVGWRVAEQRGDLRRDDLALSYKSPYGLLSLESEQSSGQTDWRVGARGAVSTMDGHVFASNTIDDSFALVDTDGIAGVQVLQENRPVGRTNGQGLLFVEGLRAYEDNQLSIDPGDVPLDVNLSTDRLQVFPRDRTGVLARFSISRSRAATVKLLDRDGRIMPLGSQVTLDASGEKTQVGYDGECFLQTLAAQNSISVQAPGHALCHAHFAWQAQAGSIPSLGPVACQ